MTLPIITKIRDCKHCEAHLPNGVRPVLSASKKSKIIIVGQAPGRVVHETGVPWSDQSGKRLRDWLGVDEATFLDADNFAIIPMGFCYPGKGKSGDLPPRKECAPMWHESILEELKEVKLTLLIGSYAQKYYLKKSKKKNLTETVLHFEEYLPEYFPIVHPSPLNARWLKKNDWFEEAVVPRLREVVKGVLA